uniref:Vinculin n=2 Tax=Romanomermis culicivorax TaxID=13658 RepID=A0A915ID47_ROMCU
MVKEKTSGNCYSEFSESVDADGSIVEKSNTSKSWKTVRTYGAGSYNTTLFDKPPYKLESAIKSSTLGNGKARFLESNARNFVPLTNNRSANSSTLSTPIQSDQSRKSESSSIKSASLLRNQYPVVQSTKFESQNSMYDYDSAIGSFSGISINNKPKTDSSTATLLGSIGKNDILESPPMKDDSQILKFKSTSDLKSNQAPIDGGDLYAPVIRKKKNSTGECITKDELEYRRKSRTILKQLKENEKRKTKFVASALDLSAQVSRLVILHEEAEDGNAMPDLTRPVDAVSRAVDNLIKVGYDTCHSSDDRILQQDMPPALQRVESSSKLLENACRLLRSDPYSVDGRRMLIDGARGGRGMEEASENRNYLMTRMMDEVNEIIRVLQLTSYDEDEWDADNLTVMKKAI